MKLPRIIFVLTLIVPVLMVVAYICGAVGEGGGLATDAALTYVLSVTTVVLSLFTAWMAMRLFRLPIVRLRMSGPNASAATWFYKMVCSIRLIVLLMVIVLDLAVFYLTNSMSAVYLAAIVFVAALFCWPRLSELDGMQKL